MQLAEEGRVTNILLVDGVNGYGRAQWGYFLSKDSLTNRRLEQKWQTRWPTAMIDNRDWRRTPIE
jgi:hypothetical protein